MTPRTAPTRITARFRLPLDQQRRVDALASGTRRSFPRDDSAMYGTREERGFTQGPTAKEYRARLSSEERWLWFGLFGENP